jgi:hypothetical protein
MCGWGARIYKVDVISPININFSKNCIYQRTINPSTITSPAHLYSTLRNLYFNMRIFLLPISTRRTLIYCERIQHQINGSQQPATSYSIGSITDKIVNKANATWADWENAEKGWKKKLTVYGNEYVFSRIPFEGTKSCFEEMSFI